MIVKVKESKKKKWEPKKKFQFQTVEIVKAIVQEKKSELGISKQMAGPTTQTLSSPGISINPTIYDLVDMISMLSQITIKLPLSEMFRIEEHKNKDLAWLGGIGSNNIVEQKHTTL